MQTPTTAVILPYDHTLGPEAVELYRKWRDPLPWQELIVYDMMALNSEDLYTHMVYGLTVPRQNGKNETLVMRELWGLAHGERILHTAHRTDTAHKAWERLGAACEAADVPISSSYRAYGKEHLYCDETGGVIEFRTRTSTGALGSSYDLLVIDEAQEYTTAQESALMYTIAASRNQQTIMTGTAPTPVSSGTVFASFRTKVLAGTVSDAAWEEWGVDEMTDPLNRDAWYIANPSLGYLLSERNVARESAGEDLDFNIQRLGYWTGFNLQSAISLLEWSRCKADRLPDVYGYMFVGIKYAKEAASVSMSIALATEDGRTFVESIDCRDGRLGNDWIVSWIRDAIDAIGAIIVDGAAGQAMLEKDLKEAGVRMQLVFPRVADIIFCNAEFEQDILQQKLVHMGQPSLEASVTNCEHRAIGSGFGFKSIKNGVEVSLMESAALAAWGLNNVKPKRKKQKISY